MLKPLKNISDLEDGVPTCIVGSHVSLKDFTTERVEVQKECVDCQGPVFVTPDYDTPKAQYVCARCFMKRKAAGRLRMENVTTTESDLAKFREWLGESVNGMDDEAVLDLLRFEIEGATDDGQQGTGL